jgi:hypothetical protein
MPPLACPRCQRTNPGDAAFCYFDGALLKSGSGNGTTAYQLPHEFIFPTGRRCQTYDELAAGCQEEWAAARELLRQGVFRQFFTSIGRMDLARACQESMGQASPDIGLTQLVSSLPVTTVKGPKLDLQPRRLNLGSLFAGETRQVPLKISNQGQGMLQGTVAVTEGGEWLKVGAGSNGQQAVQTAREQQIAVQVDTRGLAAGQTYGGKLTVVTNGGVVEVPARLDLSPHPFHKAPFLGARAPREMAERMRSNPKGAVTLLESGELSRWFSGNGWKYPVAGAVAKGVAGVQQFFEAMGLSKPPSVQLSRNDLRLVCKPGEKGRAQLALQTPVKKWVYGNVTSDAAWLRVLTPAVSGPQQAAIAIEVDARQLPGRRAEGTLRVVANAGQTLTARVRVEAESSRAAAAGGGWLAPVCAVAIAFFLLRLILFIPADMHARPRATAEAFRQALAQGKVDGLPEEHPASSYTGWLAVPWFNVFVGNGAALADMLPAGGTGTFRDTFVSDFLQSFVWWTFWLGTALWPLFLWRRGGGLTDMPFAIIAGTVVGIIATATLACLVLVGDLAPEFLWDITLRSSASPALLPVWLLLSLLCWAGLGALVGLGLQALGPLGKVALTPVQQGLAWLCRKCGLAGLADFCAPV